MYFIGKETTERGEDTVDFFEEEDAREVNVVDEEEE